MTADDTIKLLAQALEDGLSHTDALALALREARLRTADALLERCLYARAREQWTDGELLALLETALAPLCPASAESTLRLYHEACVRQRHLARGELRSRTWQLLDATMVVRDGESVLEAPDNRVRWAALKELQRQYCGWTSRGMAHTVQDQLDQLERTGGPDIAAKVEAH